MDIEDFRAYCLAFPGADDTFPFGRATSEYDRNLLVSCVAGKWFCFVNAAAFDSCTLRSTPDEIGRLRERYSGVQPGYHMNERWWVGVRFDSDVPDPVIRELAARSYALVAERLPKKVRERLASETCPDAQRFIRNEL